MLESPEAAKSCVEAKQAQVPAHLAEVDGLQGVPTGDNSCPSGAHNRALQGIGVARLPCRSDSIPSTTIWRSSWVTRALHRAPFRAGSGCVACSRPRGRSGPWIDRLRGKLSFAMGSFRDSQRGMLHYFPRD